MYLCSCIYSDLRICVFTVKMSIPIKGITKAALGKLAKKAGVKSITANCVPFLQEEIRTKLTEILKIALIMSDTKMLMEKDVYAALEALGVNIV